MKNLLFFALLFATAPIFSQANNTLVLNGSSEQVSIGTPISSGSSYTKEAWIYPAATAGAFNIISSLNAPFWINNNRLSAGHAGNYQVVMDDQNLALNTWTHVAVTYDSFDGEMKLYKNGMLIKSSALGTSYTSEPTYIGSHQGSGSFYNGKLDEIRIWNKCLSPQEIQRQMFKLPAADPIGLVQYFTCNQSATGQLTNSVSGGVNGICSGGTFSPSPILYSPNSISFDGIDDVIITPSSSDFNLTTATVEFLINPTVSTDVNSLIVGSRELGQTRFSVHVNTFNNEIGLWNGSAYAAVPYVFSIGQWVHIAVIIGPASSEVYINGSYHGNIDNGMGSAENLGLRIGASEDFEFFTGMIDEIKIWDHSRTVSQIQQFMNMEIDPSKPADVSGLMAYYNFNQATPGGDNQGFTTVFDQLGLTNGEMTGMNLNGGSSNYVGQSAMLSALALAPNSFNLKKSGPGILLNWKSVNTNTRSFNVQRSIDGRSWKNIGLIKAIPQASNYSFHDKEPVQGKNFYRLAEIDMDGKITYSEIKFIQHEVVAKSFILTGIQSSAIHVKISRPVTLRIYTASGSLVSVHSLDKGNHVLSPGNISPGIYILKTDDHTKKILIK